MFLDERPLDSKENKNKKAVSIILDKKIVYNQQEPFQPVNFGGMQKNEQYDIEILKKFERREVNVSYFKSIKPEDRNINKGIVIETFVDKITPNDFEYIHVLNRTYTGKLTEVKYKRNGKIYAMKAVKKSRLKDDVLINHFQTERYIYEKIHHPFLNQLHFSFQTEYKLYLILDCYKEGSLEQYIHQRKGFTEEEAKFYLAQICLLFEYLHSKNIIFRDLSSENVFLAPNGYIKICEISQAKANIPQYVMGTRSFCGLPEYRSPEMINPDKKPKDSDAKDTEGKDSYGKAVDIWSMGILLYEMLYSRVPFGDENNNKDIIYKKIIFNNPDFSDDKPISKDAKDLILKMLDKNKVQRIRLDQIKAHSFFNGVDFERIYQMKEKAMIIPSREGEYDYIDSNYANDNPNDSLYTGCSPIMKDHFEDFSFNEDMK